MTLPAPTQIPRAQFKGAYTFATLPTTGLKVNDLAYATDTERLYYWNGAAWAGITPVPTGLTSVVKSADEIVNNSTTYQNDDELLLAVEALKHYHVFAFLLCTVDLAYDIKCKFTVPAGASCKGWSILDYAGAGATIPVIDYTSGKAFPTGTGDYVVILDALLAVAATAGSITLQWAQNVAGVHDTKVLAGSILRLIKLD